VERPRTVTFSRPGPAADSRLPQDYTHGASTAPEARYPTDSAGERSRAAGETRGSGDGPEASFRVSWPTVRPAEQKQYWDNLAGREVEPAINWPQSAQRREHTRSYHGTVRTPCATDSDGTCQIASGKHPTQISPITRRQRLPQRCF
jgi:hypothetical protein